MVATPEKFKELCTNAKSDDLDEKATKQLVAAYEEEEGLETVPVRPLKTFLKFLKEKGFSLPDDSSLAPFNVLKQWCLSPTPGSDEESVEKESNDLPIDENGSNSSKDSAARRRRHSKKRKHKRSPSRSARSKAKRSKRHGAGSSNIFESLRDAASGNTSVDSGTDSDLSSFTKERRKKRRPPPHASSSSSDSGSVSSPSSSDSSGEREKPQEETLRAIPRRQRQMKLLCDRKESKNLFGGFIARAMNVTAYVATLKFRSMRNKREAETLGRTIDFIVDQYGKKAISHMDACEVLLRRFTAVLHADSSTWEFATNFEECPEGPFVGARMYSRVKKMAKLAGVRPPAMRMTHPPTDSWRPQQDLSRANPEPWRGNFDRRKEERDPNKKPNRRLQGTRVMAAPSRPTPDDE
jgi:hypothetical protein